MKETLYKPSRCPLWTSVLAGSNIQYTPLTPIWVYKNWWPIKHFQSQVPYPNLQRKIDPTEVTRKVESQRMNGPPLWGIQSIEILGEEGGGPMIELSLIIRSVVGLQLLSLKDMRSFLGCFTLYFSSKVPRWTANLGKWSNLTWAYVWFMCR